MPAKSVYIHIPFCEQRCYYCAFTVALSPESKYGPYVSRVLREIDCSGFDSPPASIYFGGGTPSIISVDLIADLVRRFNPGAAEITIETNPGTLSAEKIAGYREIGITRISLGAQSLEDDDLQKAGRIHKARHVIDDYEALRTAGFENINLDLIAGLPEQSFGTWDRNLDTVLSLRPDHISIYMLDAEERSVWGRNEKATPSDDEFALFYTEAARRLESAGYRHYEISNWALPGRECVHNLRYWSGESYRGFGVSAHSYEPYRRFWNTASLIEYETRIDAGRLPIEREEQLTREMRLDESFMLGLRRISGFDVTEVAKELGFEYPREWYVRVRDLAEAGWIDFDGRILKLTPAGWMIASTITEELLWPSPTSTFEAIP